jgi:hypothetical protein
LRSYRHVHKGPTSWPKLVAAGKALPESVSFPVIIDNVKWFDHQRFELADGRQGRLEIGAAEYTNAPRTSLRKARRENSRFLNRKRFSKILVEPPIVRADDKVAGFLDKELDKFKANYHSAPTASQQAKDPNAIYSHPDWGACVSDGQLGRYLRTGEHKGTVTKKDKRRGHDFRDSWQNKPSRVRKGEMALRTFDALNMVRGKTGKIETRRSAVCDVDDILLGKESTHPLTGKPAIPRPGAKTDRLAKDSIQAFLLANGPRMRDEFHVYCKEQKISISQRKDAVKKLKIRHEQVGAGLQKVSYVCLPGQQIQNRLLHSPALCRAVEFLKKTVPCGDTGLDRQDILEAARPYRISEFMLHKAMRLAGVTSDWYSRNGHRHAKWKRVRGIVAESPAAGSDAAALVPSSPTPRKPGPKPSSAVKKVYHICALVYNDQSYANLDKKRYIQLAEVQRRLVDARKVPDVRTMRTYAARHDPTVCEECKNIGK